MKGAFKTAEATRFVSVVRGTRGLPANIRQAIYLSASILRRMSGNELDFRAGKGLIKGDAKNCGGSR